MLTDTLFRLATAAVIIAAGLFVYWGWNRWRLSHLRRAGSSQLLGLEARPAHTAAVLYFRTPECVVCSTVQRPALDRLAADLGREVHIIEIDATAQPAVADYWGVLSVPTTFVIDAAGQPRAVNHGLTSKEKLLRQLENVRAVPAEQPARTATSAGTVAVLDTAESEWSARHESYPRTH